MIIRTVEVLPCIQRQQDTGWKFARGSIAEVRGWTIKITSDSGIVGIGYGHALASVSGHAEGVKAALDFLSPRIVDRDTRELKAIVASMDAALVFNPSAKAGLEMALYDLVARGLSTSVGTLMGGRMRDRIAMSRLVPLKSPDEMAQKSLELASEGCRTLKLKLSGQPDLDRERILTVRKTIGADVKLTLDPNQAYSHKGFLSSFAGFSDAGITLVEQPVPATDISGLKFLTRTLPVAVEADESAASLADVVRLAHHRVVDVVNLKIAKLGGVRATLAAIEVCEANGIACRFGASFGPSLLQAFTAHVAAVSSRLEHACEMAEHLHLLDDPFSPFKVENGEIEVPNGIGSGVDLRP